MSLIRFSRPSAEVRTASANLCCSGVRGVRSSSAFIPMTPFMGVRISWLMLARNSLLARLAESDSRAAAAKAASARLRSVMFCSAPTTRTGRPRSSRSTSDVENAQTSLPSARRSRYSTR